MADKITTKKTNSDVPVVEETVTDDVVESTKKSVAREKTAKKYSPTDTIE